MTATGGPDFFGLFPQGASTVEEEEDVVLEDVDNNKESPAEDSPRVPSPVDVDVAMGEAVSPVETQQSEEPVPSVGDLMKRMRSSKDPLKDVFSTLLWDERSLAALETGSFANEFVLPLYLETKTVSDETLFSLVILMNQKARAEGTLSSAEALLNADPNKFSKTVGRILKAFLDPPSIVSPAHRLSLKREILIFLCSLFSSLHLPALRAEALKLVGIGAWTTLVSDTARARLFQAAPELQDLWSRSEDKFKDIEKKSTKERISFERSFLSRAIGDFLTVIEGDQDSATTDIPAVASYVEWFLEFLIVLVSQLPTRRFSHALMEDHLVLVQIERSDYYKKARSRADAMTKKQQQLSVLSLREASKAGLVFLEQTQRLRLYLLGFGIDNRTGLPMSSTEVTHVQHSRLRSIQKLCFEHFRDDAADLALTNVGALATPGVLRDYLQDLSLKSLVFLSKELGIRSRPHHKKGHPDSKEFILDVFVRTFEELPQNERDLNALQASPVYPTELSLSQTLNYAASASSIGSLCYPIPKLHGQFLSSKDYACRSYELLRLEATESLRQDVLDVSKRLSPRLNPVTDGSSAEKTVFGGWASMGAPVSSVDFLL